MAGAATKAFEQGAGMLQGRPTSALAYTPPPARSELDVYTPYSNEASTTSVVPMAQTQAQAPSYNTGLGSLYGAGTTGVAGLDALSALGNIISRGGMNAVNPTTSYYQQMFSGLNNTEK